MSLVTSIIEELGIMNLKEDRENKNFYSSTEPYDEIYSGGRADFLENLLVSSPSLSAEAAAASLRYQQIWNDNEDVIMQSNHHAVPDDFMKPADIWMEENDVLALAELPML